MYSVADSENKFVYTVLNSHRNFKITIYIIMNRDMHQLVVGNF